MIAIALNIR